jgi:hypothetical protein
MATIGQCRACDHPVSDEAAACPGCGQPRPFLPLPALGSVHRARIEHVSTGDETEYAGVRLVSGIHGVVSRRLRRYVDGVDERFKIGNDIQVKVANVDGHGGEVKFAMDE